MMETVTVGHTFILSSICLVHQANMLLKGVAGISAPICKSQGTDERGPKRAIPLRSFLTAGCKVPVSNMLKDLEKASWPATSKLNHWKYSFTRIASPSCCAICRSKLLAKALICASYTRKASSYYQFMTSVGMRDAVPELVKA